MSPRSIKPEFPLDPMLFPILGVVAEEAALAGIDLTIVGATARDLILTHVFGIAPRRASHDIDFAVAVDSWEQFDQIRTRLAAREGFDTSNRMKQRLYYGGNKKEYGYPLDLVPFGGIAHDKDEVIWPRDMQVTMSVAGYREVLHAAEQVELAPGFGVRVASLPGLVILKLVAWSDRGASEGRARHLSNHDELRGCGEWRSPV